MLISSVLIHRKCVTLSKLLLLLLYFFSYYHFILNILQGGISQYSQTVWVHNTPKMWAFVPYSQTLWVFSILLICVNFHSPKPWYENQIHYIVGIHCYFITANPTQRGFTSSYGILLFLEVEVSNIIISIILFIKSFPLTHRKAYHRHGAHIET